MGVGAVTTDHPLVWGGRGGGGGGTIDVAVGTGVTTPMLGTTGVTTPTFATAGTTFPERSYNKKMMMMMMEMITYSRVRVLVTRAR